MVCNYVYLLTNRITNSRAFRVIAFPCALRVTVWLGLKF